jgi:hypothetical protein
MEFGDSCAELASEVRVQYATKGQDIPVGVELLGPGSFPPGYHMQEIVIVPNPDKLLIQPDAPFTMAKLDLMERISQRILRALGPRIGPAS